MNVDNIINAAFAEPSRLRRAQPPSQSPAAFAVVIGALLVAVSRFFPQLKWLND